ncbi:carboxymuconolactone decarboxylase family protein [Streptomyces sp. NPDC050997]|uniref:carboxymuconolactone decarboxylase family protein n=1 Tax=Streptomyces sp. NPDC050997 TaxID=3155519 RepID=UPI0034482016
MTDTAPATTGRRVFVDKQSPEAYQALTATAETVRGVAAAAGLDRLLVELVNIRVSQINACAYCLNLHTRAALRAGETTQRLGVLPAWRDTQLFTPHERAALALAEATTCPADSAVQESAWAQARLVLSDDEISAVIWVAITINAFNRVSVMSKHPVRGVPVPPPSGA